MRGPGLAAASQASRSKVKQADAWKVKKAHLKVYHARLKSVVASLRRMEEGHVPDFKCTHVRREFNKRADALANDALDSHAAFLHQQSPAHLQFKP